jgi:pimeloyl-ACP methyl ester carboxylesterase
MRGDALDSYEAVYLNLGKSPRPSLLLWGDKDQDIPRRHIELVRAAVPSIEYHELPGFSHGLTFEGHEVVTQHLLRFLHAS